MRLLLDTHILLWATLTPDRLSTAERDILSSADSVAVSTISLWELRLKWDSLHPSGERKGPASPASVYAVVEAMGWRIVPLAAAHAIADLREPLGHKDPFDELLLVQAQDEGRRLLTRDRQLAGHPLAVKVRTNVERSG